MVSVMHLAFFTFLYTFFLLLQDSLKTSDKRYQTTFVIKSIRRDTKVNTGLLGVVTIPIPHVIVVRTVGPTRHRYPLDKAICLENHILHLQLGLVTMDFFLQEAEEDRDGWVDGSSLGLLWHSNALSSLRSVHVEIPQFLHLPPQNIKDHNTIEVTSSR